MKEDLYWLVLVIVVAAASGGLYYEYKNTRPCVQPIPYAVGAVDTRFSITQTALLNDAAVAAEIWNKAAGKTVLTYDPKAAMKISLIYDEREASAKLGIEIALKQADMDTAHTALDALQAQFISEQTTYNQEVSAINARGGATPNEVTALNAEKRSINALASSINDKAASYNASVIALNAVVAQYNQNTGQTFEEGRYVQDSTGRRIDIFEFVGTTQLERVLAHEFGHALGLGHNDDPKAIMYAKNESGNLVPTTADLTALRALCGA